MRIQSEFRRPVSGIRIGYIGLKAVRSHYSWFGLNSNWAPSHLIVLPKTHYGTDLQSSRSHDMPIAQFSLKRIECDVLIWNVALIRIKPPVWTQLMSA
jgi:hypothetical protein